MASIGGAAINLSRIRPVIDFTSMDAESMLSDFQAYAQANWSDRWTDFNADQFAIVFLDIQTYIGDMLTFYLNTTVREYSVQTAQRRQHIVELAKTLDYHLASASSSTGYLDITSIGALLPYTVSKDYQFSAGSIVFQPDQDYPLTVANKLSGPDGDGNYIHRISVVQGEGYTDVSLGTSDGSREQNYILPQSPLIDGTLTVKVNGVAWTEVSSFYLSEPSSTHYRVETNDEDETTIYFGDGINGKIPPITQGVTATWKIGGGRQGRVGANSITNIVTPVAAIDSVTNPNVITDGENKEGLNTARMAIPLSLSAGDRAVTLMDYATTAKRSSASIAKATAHEIDAKLIRIVVAPSGGGVATDALKSAAATYVNNRRMAGRRAIFGDPTYVPCQVELDVYVEKSTSRDAMQGIIESLFRTNNAASPQLGIFDFPNVGFGARDDSDEPQLTVQRVYDMLANQASRGVQASNLALFRTIPFAKPQGVVQGNGTFTSTYGTSKQLCQRRQWRVTFLTATTYEVYERIVGRSTALTPTVLTDDRVDFNEQLNSAANTYVNPNRRQSLTYPLASYSATQLSIQSGNDMYGGGSPEDYYYVEFPVASGVGLVGTPYEPTDDITFGYKGIAWTFTAGLVSWSAGETYIIDQFGLVDDLLLDFDEIPTLAAADLTVNIKSAV